ncbi:MAG: hypothetical protein JJE09_12005 [Bacteroidia bacterium]|nr:hypothetical protein [Bacteroidia bacterium]
MASDQNFQSLLYKVILPKVELVAAIISCIGLVLNYLKLPGASELIMIGFSTLASVFFLIAYTPLTPGKPLQPERPKTFIDLLSLIVWKVVHIALAVTTIGLLFYLLHLKGFSQMMLIGTIALLLSLFLSGVIIVQNNKYLSTLKPTLIKAVVMAIIGTYILYFHWPISP